MYKVVSLFSGIGGIDLGFQQAGFEICWANDVSHAACETYRHNFGGDCLIEGNIREINADTIPHADILVAGFPCQSFSKAGAERGFQDSRGQLFFDVIRVAEAIQPKVIFLENVANLVEHDNGRTFQIIYTSLVGLGYIIHYRVMPTHEYANIPQTRRRIYIVATNDMKISRPFCFPEPIPLTMGIEDVIDRRMRQPDIYYFTGDSPFEKKAREIVNDRRYIYRAFHGTISAMHNRKCPTLTASIYKPQEAIMVRDDHGVRRLTLRECLRFQGFPESFYFPKTISIDDAYQQIGNSVSVPVICRIAKAILGSLCNCS